MNKRLLFLLSVVCFFLQALSRDFVTIGHVTNASDGIRYSVSALVDNGKIKDATLYGLCPQSDRHEASITLDYSKISKFISFLENCRDKFGDWSFIAQNEGVLTFQKDMPFEFKPVCVSWSVDYKYFSWEKPTLRATFDVSMGVCRLVLNCAGLYKYVGDGINFSLAFSSVEQIDELINLLKNKNFILGEASKKSSRDALFK